MWIVSRAARAAHEPHTGIFFPPSSFSSGTALVLDAAAAATLTVCLDVCTALQARELIAACDPGHSQLLVDAEFLILRREIPSCTAAA